MTNSDARAPRDRACRVSAIFDRQSARGEIESILGERDPERPRQIARAATEIAVDVRATFAPSACHQSDAVDRLERANQDRRRRAFSFCDCVDQVMDPVVQVDVRDTRWAIEWRIARGRSWRCVTGGIVFADVGFGLDDHPGRDTGTCAMHKHLPEQILCDAEEGIRKTGKPYRKIADRTEAIHQAISEARDGDLVLIAGKGHEDYQIIGRDTFHFDDKEVARSFLTTKA